MVIALCRGKGLISALVRWQTWSKYSHAAVVLSDGWVIEAWPGKGVHRRPFWKDIRGIDLFQVNCSFDGSVEDWLNSQLGKGYDYLGVLRLITRWRKSNDRWFCSELIFQALRFGGVQLLRGIRPAQVSPGLLSYSPLLKPL